MRPDITLGALRVPTVHCQVSKIVACGPVIVRQHHLNCAPYALADAEQTMNINVLAPIRLAVGFARLYWCFHPKENVKFRRNVINVSSTAGLYVYPDLGQALYATSKAALNQATYHLASELWDIGIRVNVVAPNSFPDIVPVESVLDQIAAFDNSEETGRISVLHT